MVHTHFSGDWQVALLGYFLFSGLLYALPEPLPGERWYTAFYRFMHFVGMNLDRVGLFKRNGNSNGNGNKLPPIVQPDK